MDKRIFKYELEHAKVQRILMPFGAQILDAQAQPGSGLVMWALIDKNQLPVMRQFAMYMTGQKLPDNPGEHVVTVQGIAMTDEGPQVMVYHLFEVQPTAEGS